MATTLHCRASLRERVIRTSKNAYKNALHITQSCTNRRGDGMHPCPIRAVTTSNQSPIIPSFTALLQYLYRFSVVAIIVSGIPYRCKSLRIQSGSAQVSEVEHDWSLPCSRDVVSVLNVSVSRRFLERLGLVSVSRVWKNRTSRSHLGLEDITSRSRVL